MLAPRQSLISSALASSEKSFFKVLALPFAEGDKQRIPRKKAIQSSGSRVKSSPFWANVLVPCCWTTCITKRSCSSNSALTASGLIFWSYSHVIM